MPRLLQLNLLILLWSFTAILAEYIGLQTPVIVFWRTLIASLGFWLFWQFRKARYLHVAKPTSRQIGTAWITGFLLGLHWLCFFGAMVVANVSIGLAGFAATSLFTALLQPFFEKKPPSRSELLLALLVAAGLLLIANAGTTVPDSLTGLLIALLGALLAAIYGLSSKQLVDAKLPGPLIMLHQIPAAGLAACLAILLIPQWSFAMPQSENLAPLFTLALACTVGAYLWYADLLRHLSAYTISLAVNFEPVFGIMMAFVLFQEHESLAPSFFIGTSAILIANFIHARLSAKQRTNTN